MKDIAAGYAYSDLLISKTAAFEPNATYRIQVRSGAGSTGTLYATLKTVTGAQPGISYVDDKTLRLRMSAAQTAPMVKSVFLDVVREDTNPDEYLGNAQTIKVVVPVTAPEAEVGTGTNPQITSDNPSGSYPEGEAIGGLLEADRSVTWAKSGVDAYAVTLNPATGAWTLEETNYDEKRSYAFTFTASDTAGRTAQQTVAISITNVTVTPAPAFTTQPSITPGSGTAGTTSFSWNRGTASDTTSYAVRFLLNGAVIATPTNPFIQQTAGTLVLEVTATGPGGSTVATASVVVTAAASASIQSANTGTAAFRATGASSERQVFPINDLSQLTAAGGSGGVADVPLAITFDGSPSVIQCRSVDFTTGAQITPWATLVSNPSGTSWEGVFPMREYDGWQKLELRIGTSGVASLTTTQRIGAGLLIGIEGQSQARYFSTNVGGTTGSTSFVPDDLTSVYAQDGMLITGAGEDYTLYPDVGWHYAGATYQKSGKTFLAGGGSGAAEAGKAARSALKVPVAFISNTIGGVGLDVLNASPAQPGFAARYAEVGRPHYVTMLAQGGNDLGASEATYTSRLNSWRAWHLASTNYTPSRRFVMFPLGRRQTGTTTDVLAIRRSQMAFVASNPADTIYGGWGYDISLADDVHQDVNGNALYGRRLAAAVINDVLGTGASIGPQISSVTRSGAVLTVNTTLAGGGTALETPLITSTGDLSAAAFEVTRISDGAALTVASISVSGTAITLTLAADPGGPVSVRYGAVRSPGARSINDNTRFAGGTRGGVLRPLLTGLESTGGGTPTPSGKAAKVNIGSGTQPTSPGFSFNTFGAAATGGASQALKDLSGAATGWTITAVTAFEAVAATGGFVTGNNSGIVPDDVLVSYATSKTAARLDISGLDPAKQYRVRLVPSRDASAARPTVFSINSSAAQTVDAFDNATLSALFDGVSPTSGGVLEIRITLGSGNTTGSYLNAIIVEELA